MVLPIDMFYEKTGVRLLYLFLDTSFKISHYVIILTLVGVECHIVGGESVNTIWPDCHGD